MEVVKKLILKEGKQFRYRAKLKPRLKEVELKVSDANGALIGTCTVYRNRYFLYHFPRTRRAKEGRKMLHDVTKNFEPKAYLTDVVLWMIKQ